MYVRLFLLQIPAQIHLWKLPPHNSLFFRSKPLPDMYFLLSDISVFFVPVHFLYLFHSLYYSEPDPNPYSLHHFFVFPPHLSCYLLLSLLQQLQSELSQIRQLKFQVQIIDFFFFSFFYSSHIDKFIDTFPILLQNIVYFKQYLPKYFLLK